MKQFHISQELKEACINLDSVEDRYYLFALLGSIANRMQAVGDTVFAEVTWKQ